MQTTLEKTKEIVEQGFKLNKSEEDIALDLSMAYPDESNEGIIESLKTAKKAIQLSQALQAEKASASAVETVKNIEKKLEAKVDAQFNELSKKINIQTGAGKVEKINKRFCLSRGAYVELNDKENEDFSHFNKMLCFLSLSRNGQDLAMMQEANAISREIDQQIAMDLSNNPLYAKKISVTDIAAQGGNAVATTVNDTIHQLLYEISVLFSLTNKTIVQYNTHEIPVFGKTTITTRPDQSTDMSEATPAFYKVALTPKTLYAFHQVSNDAIDQLGSNLVDGFIRNAASALAETIDMFIACGSVNNSDACNGIAFDALTTKLAPVALSSLTASSVWSNLVTGLSPSARRNRVLIGNERVLGQLGFLQSTGGQPLFPDFARTGASGFNILGVPYVANPFLLDTLNYTTSNRLTGTETALICADMNSVYTALTESTRVDISQDFAFKSDATCLRIKKKFGQVVASGANTAGKVAIAQRLS